MESGVEVLGIHPVGGKHSLDSMKQRKIQRFWIIGWIIRFSDRTKSLKKLKINPDVIAEDIQFYKSYGFEQITTFAGYLSDDYRELHGEPLIAEYINILN